VEKHFKKIDAQLTLVVSKLDAVSFNLQSVQLFFDLSLIEPYSEKLLKCKTLLTDFLNLILLKQGARERVTAMLSDPETTFDEFVTNRIRIPALNELALDNFLKINKVKSIKERSESASAVLTQRNPNDDSKAIVLRDTQSANNADTKALEIIESQLGTKTTKSLMEASLYASQNELAWFSKEKDKEPVSAAYKALPPIPRK